MQRLLKVAVLPINIISGDRDENLYNVTQQVNQLGRDVDVVVLPELFSTGFISDAQVMRKLADSKERQLTLDYLRELANKQNFAISGSLLWRDAESYYNRCFFIEPSGETTCYDKHHLFRLSKEPKLFTVGQSQSPVVRYRGWNIAMAICYDVRFPVWLRNKGNRYDLLLVPANWPTQRGYDWKQLLIARAIENQACVVGANRSGSDNFGDYDNNSFLFDHHGRDVGATIVGTNAVIATFSLDEVERLRREFPVNDDADDFTISKS
jgi:predicted amidohydrolase